MPAISATIGPNVTWMFIFYLATQLRGVDALRVYRMNRSRPSDLCCRISTCDVAASVAEALRLAGESQSASSSCRVLT